jgi:hypothetical protein
MKNTLITFIISIFFANSSFSQINTEYQLKEAGKTVVNWLNNLNTTNYPLCYEEMSFQFKNNTDSVEIVSLFLLEIESFGEFLGRKEISRKFASNPIEFDERLSNYPDGYYAVFVFKSNYENWKFSEDSGIETLILHQDYKSRWRILDWITEFESEE